MPFIDFDGNIFESKDEAIKSNIIIKGEPLGKKIIPPEVPPGTFTRTKPKNVITQDDTFIYSQTGASPKIAVGAVAPKELKKSYKVNLSIYYENQQLLDKGILLQKANYTEPSTGQRVVLMTPEQMAFNKLVFDYKRLKGMYNTQILPYSILTNLQKEIDKLKAAKVPPPVTIPRYDVKDIDYSNEVEEIDVYEILEN